MEELSIIGKDKLGITNIKRPFASAHPQHLLIRLLNQ